jgi:lipoprotein-anchoring transpeptidase ErfK/SrfK
LGWDKAGFGIHGTVEPETLGTQASQGCVRMHNDAVAEVFMLFPRGTIVTVRD